MLDILEKVKAEIPSIRVAVVGDGELREEFERKIQEKALNENITLFGFQDNPYPIIKRFKLLLMPSLWEGFGLAAVEALSLGVPVVCSNAGGLPTIVDQSCGKVYKDIQDYTEEIKKVLLDEKYQTAKSEGAQNKARLLKKIKR